MRTDPLPRDPDWDDSSGWDDEPGTVATRPSRGAWAPPGAWPGGGPSPFGTPGAKIRTPRLGPALRRRLLRALVALLAVGALAAVVLGVVAYLDRPKPPVPDAPYAFSLPDGWADRTVELGPSFGEARPDVVIAGPPTSGFTINIAVHRSPSGTDPPDLRDLPELIIREQHAALDAERAGPFSTLSLAGAPAMRFDVLYLSGGFHVRAREVVAYRGGERYLIMLVAPNDAFDQVAPALDELLRSWRWVEE